MNLSLADMWVWSVFLAPWKDHFQCFLCISLCLHQSRIYCERWNVSSKNTKPQISSQRLQGNVQVPCRPYNWRSEWIIWTQWTDFLVTPGVLLIWSGLFLVSSSHLLSDAVIVTNVQQWGSCLPGHPAATGSTPTSLFPPADQPCLVCPGPFWALPSSCGVDRAILQDIFSFEKKTAVFFSSCPLQHLQPALCCGCHCVFCKLLGSLQML